jgi:dynein heavy chain 1
MKKIYLENPEYDFNKINNASKACGPLVKWAKAQVIKKLKLTNLIFLRK